MTEDKCSGAACPHMPSLSSNTLSLLMITNKQRTQTVDTTFVNTVIKLEHVFHLIIEHHVPQASQDLCAFCCSQMPCRAEHAFMAELYACCGCRA